MCKKKTKITICIEIMDCEELNHVTLDFCEQEEWEISGQE